MAEPLTLVKCLPMDLFVILHGFISFFFMDASQALPCLIGVFVFFSFLKMTF